MNGTFEQAKDYFLKGLEQAQSGQLAQAESSFGIALALVPGRPSTLTNLGAVKLKLGKLREALELLQQAVQQQPGNLEALGHASNALAELGRHDEALKYVDRALDIDAAQGPAWSMRGSLLKDLNRRDAAVASFQRAIELGADEELHRYYIASLQEGEVPPAPPRHYVEMLFDGYAEQFEGHLLALNYQAPRVLVERLQGMGRTFACALDLGCGTGLCGVLLRALAARIDGVDLSAQMVAKASSLGLYRHVVQEDLVQYLDRTDQRYDLVLAADVFIYVGALEPVFAAVAKVTDSGALFCFCVEAGDEARELALRPSLRYVHSEKYVLRLAECHGFDLLASQRQPVRDDQRLPIPGLYFWLQRR